MPNNYSILFEFLTAYDLSNRNFFLHGILKHPKNELYDLDSISYVQILVHLHFDLVSWLLALEATEPVSEPVTQMAVELVNIQTHFSTAKEM